jgi:hypothetical protein
MERESKTRQYLVPVGDVGPSEKDAWQEVDRQRLRENANQYQPFRWNNADVVVQFLIRMSFSGSRHSGTDLKVEQRSQSPSNT